MQLIRVNQTVLALTEEEASRLRVFFQNPIYDDESKEEARWRNKMFEIFKEYTDALTPPKVENKCLTCLHKYEEDSIPF